MLRLAMWSGPRNISTAMMRSWGNRDDSVVCDEPLYAHYLRATGKDHPGASEIIASGETDWQKVVADLTADIPGGKRIYFQKHMTHHLLPHISREWLGSVTSCFLIRDPREMLTSYIKIVSRPSLEDTGFPQQTEIFEWVRSNLKVTPPVMDSVDVLNNPRRAIVQVRGKCNQALTAMRGNHRMMQTRDILKSWAQSSHLGIACAL